MFKSLADFISVLEDNNELIRIKEFVDPNLEITEIVDRESKKKDGGKALHFENNGTDLPALINAFSSLKRISLALGVDDLDDIGKQIDDLFKKITSPKDNLFDKLKVLPLLNELASWMPKSVSRKGICQEIIDTNPDLNKLPVLNCWPADGGKFITLPMVNTKDPITNIRNVGMYRMQLFGSQLTGMHWHLHKTGARHYNEFKSLGKKMPVAVALGGDPAYTYAATAPLPDNIDEYMLAGFLRKKKVELVKCITQDIEVPNDADIIIEGYVDTAEDLIWEGPFGDHTGFYSLADWYPKFHVTCITHKKNAIYPATIVGIPPQEDAYIGKATERIFLKPIQYAMLPEIQDLNLPHEGVAHNIVIVKIKKTYPGQAQKVMNTLWGAGQMMFSKFIIVIDDSIEISNYSELAKSVLRNVNPAKDIYFFEGPSDILDHAANQKAFGGKLGLDATVKLYEEKEKKPASGLSILFNDEVEQGSVINENILRFTNNQSIVVLSIDKKKMKNINSNINYYLSKNDLFPKFLILVDKDVDVNQLNIVSWIVGGNVDPSVDCELIRQNTDNIYLQINATRKILPKDDFSREWPNVVTMDEKTISSIDKKWNDLGLGDFVSSPSIKYGLLKIGNDAVIK